MSASKTAASGSAAVLSTSYEKDESRVICDDKKNVYKIHHCHQDPAMIESLMELNITSRQIAKLLEKLHLCIGTFEDSLELIGTSAETGEGRRAVRRAIVSDQTLVDLANAKLVQLQLDSEYIFEKSRLGRLH